jgi:hypothetical protein
VYATQFLGDDKELSPTLGNSPPRQIRPVQRPCRGTGRRDHDDRLAEAGEVSQSACEEVREADSKCLGI